MVAVSRARPALSRARTALLVVDLQLPEDRVEPTPTEVGVASVPSYNADANEQRL